MSAAKPPRCQAQAAPLTDDAFSLAGSDLARHTHDAGPRTGQHRCPWTSRRPRCWPSYLPPLRACPARSMAPLTGRDVSRQLRAWCPASLAAAATCRCSPRRSRNSRWTPAAFGRLHLDHLPPVAMGGANGPTRHTPADCHTPPVESRACGTAGHPRHQDTPDDQEGELLTVADAARELGLAPSTLHRWLSDGFIPGEQLTPAARGGSGSPRHPRPVRRRRPRRLAGHAGGHPRLGVSRQTIMQRVKDGRLRAVHVRTGRRKGLRIEPPAP
jgi:hypothetical protein